MTSPVANAARETDAPTTVATAIVTVVIPVRNEANFIARTLDQVLDQDLEGIELEIFVVDGQSTDATREIVRNYADRTPEITLLENPKRLSSAARNLAIKQMRGDYLVLIDGHCEIPSRRYFRDLIDAFDESGADCLGRPQPLNVSQATPIQQAIALARSSRLGHHPESFIYSDQPQFVPAKSVAVAYRRKVFERVGLFDESFDAHEDGEFNYRCDRAGLKCYLDPRLTINYYPRASLRGLFQQLMRYGRGRVRLLQKHGGGLTLGTVAPAIFVAGILGGPVACAAFPRLWVVYVVAICAYLVLTSLEAFRLGLCSGNLKVVPLIPIVLWVVHFGSGSGLLAEGICGVRQHNR